MSSPYIWTDLSRQNVFKCSTFNDFVLGQFKLIPLLYILMHLWWNNKLKKFIQRPWQLCWGLSNKKFKHLRLSKHLESALNGSQLSSDKVDTGLSSDYCRVDGEGYNAASLFLTHALPMVIQSSPWKLTTDSSLTTSCPTPASLTAAKSLTVSSPTPASSSLGPDSWKRTADSWHLTADNWHLPDSHLP